MACHSERQLPNLAAATEHFLKGKLLCPELESFDVYRKLGYLIISVRDIKFLPKDPVIKYLPSINEDLQNYCRAISH